MVTFLTLTRQFFLHTTPIDVINSWGISKMYATQIVKNVNGEDFTMAALVMQVNGFQFQGKVYIALDEGSDYYRIYGEKDGTTKEYHHDIAFDELGDVLDSMIETGGMTKEDLQDFFIIILACPSKRDSGFALAIELDDKGKGLVDCKEVR